MSAAAEWIGWAAAGAGGFVLAVAAVSWIGMRIRLATDGRRLVADVEAHLASTAAMRRASGGDG